MIEKTILRNLIKNETYCRKVLPFLKKEYFTSTDDNVLFQEIVRYVNKYNVLPNENEVKEEVLNLSNVKADVVKSCEEILDKIKADKTVDNLAWLIDTTEEFCKQKAIYLAMSESLEIMNGKKGVSVGSIPQKLMDAVSVSFDPNVGHDFLDQSDSRYAFMHKKEVKIPFDLDYMNRITDGGVSIKTLNIILAGTGVGKTLAMCHFAAANLAMGKNVLYITMEMAEERIAERIDANLLNVDLDTLKQIPKATYDAKIAALKAKTTGKLIIKEYPTAGAGATHFRALLNELYLKKSFRPDIIYIDYLNICCSSRLVQGNSVNSYTYIKAIAEELRGLAVEFSVPIWSATQTTRGGYNNSDVGLEDTSESFGLPATADFMVAFISTEDLEKLGQIMVKQLKNRYSDISVNKRFILGVDRAKMRLFDTSATVQSGIIDSGQTKPNKFNGIKV